MTLVERDTPPPPAVLPKLFDPYEEIARRARPHWRTVSLFGYAVIILFFGGFGGFAAFAPLHSAVMATAQLRVDNERKVVQHFEGGIVAQLMVREGQRVQEGEVLLRLDPTRDNAQANVLRKRYLAALAERARLLAERDAAPAVTFPPELLSEISDPEIAEIVEGQRAVFRSRQTSREGQTKLILGQIDQARTQIEAVKIERASVQEQLALIDRELRSVKELFAKGLERLPRVLALERNQAALKGQIGRLTGQIAQLEKQIGDGELRIAQLEHELQSEVAVQLDAVVDQIQQIKEQQPVVTAAVRRLDIRAPRAGRVIDLQVHTIGQVVGRGEQIMQIVPDDEDLIVVAKVSPRDIDSLNNGVTRVQVRMTSFSQRFTHPVEAHLESISTDVVSDGDGTPPYYRAIIRLDRESREHLLHGVELTSGMPALAMIGVGEKTLLTYLIEPLSRSISDSFREP